MSGQELPATQNCCQDGDLRQQGILTDEEFKKLKADLLSKM